MSSDALTPAKVVLTERALRDIEVIRDYSVEQWGESVAEKYLDEIESALNRLRSFPDLLREEPDFSSRLRFYSAGKHYLICDRIDQTIVVLTILHASRDLPGRLGKYEPSLIIEAELLHKQLEQTKRL